MCQYANCQLVVVCSSVSIRGDQTLPDAPITVEPQEGSLVDGGERVETKELRDADSNADSKLVILV